jgi:hypothetical protein
MSHFNKGLKNTIQYYTPYESDDESGTDEESGEESDSEDPRIRREQDPRYAILRTPGPNLNVTNTQNKYSHDSYGKWDSSTDIRSLQDHVYLDPPKTTKTSLISIKSINRDKTVWPTAYRFQLKLPRVYKHVTKFQLVQLSFPNGNSRGVKQEDLITSTIVRNLLSTGVPSTCISNCISLIDCTGIGNGMGLIEQGRINSNGDPLLVSLSIPDGNYDDNQMAKEFTFRANSTPPFNIITYEQFRDIFINTRDISVLFNEPGECFYSNVTHRKYNNHTKNDIMSIYYTQQHIDTFPIITEKIAFNAYYYPILKEAIATQRAQPFLITGVFTYEDVVNRVTGLFEGLNSDTYYELCLLNRGALDTYRRHLTFQLRNINKYICSYNQQQRRCTIVHDTLHLSIQRDLTKKYTNCMEQQLSLVNLNTHTFTTLKNNLISYSAILKHLEINLSSVLGEYHFVSGYKYSGGENHITTESTFNVIQDLDKDIQFTTMFQYTSSIGNIYGNYNGMVMTFSSFIDYHSTISSYYHIVQSTTNRISSVNGVVNYNYHSYVSTKYDGIFPKSMIENKTYTMNQGLPVSFVTNQMIYIPGESYNAFPDDYDNAQCLQICCSTLRSIIKTWYGCLPTNYVIQTPQYRLGVINILPNQFNIVSTVLNIASTGITDLFIAINDEQGFNNMDVTMPENYNISNDTTGQIKLVSAKILMNAIGEGGISQTVIQNPSLFDNGLGKLDKLDIKIYYDDQAITPAWLYQPYFLDIQEWTATFQIDEEIGFANRKTGWGDKPTIPISSDPNDTPYLFFTHKDNPNNT